MSTKKLSIAYVFDGNYTAGEGIPGYIKTFGDYYTSSGHKVSYIVGESNSLDPSVHALGNTKTVRLNGNRIDIPLYTPKAQLAKILDDVDPNILHVQMPYSPLFGGQLVNLAKQTTALVGTFHIVPASRLTKISAPALSYINRSSQAKFDCLISDSPSAQAFAKSAFDLDTEILPCPIDLEYFKKGRKLTKYDDAKTNIVFLGRLVERKGCRYLLDAIAALEASYRSKIRVLIGGRGPLQDKLRAQVSATGLEDTVSFLGFIEDEEKADLLASADIAVFPSTSGESFGIVLIEAMASRAGVVIGGNNTGYNNVLNGASEMLFNPRDVDAFSSMLADLISKPKKIHSLHGIQQELVKQYDISILGPKMLEVYKNAKDKSSLIYL